MLILNTKKKKKNSHIKLKKKMEQEIKLLDLECVDGDKNMSMVWMKLKSCRERNKLTFWFFRSWFL